MPEVSTGEGPAFPIPSPQTEPRGPVENKRFHHVNFPEEASFLLERTEIVCGRSKWLRGGCLGRKEDVLIYSRCETWPGKLARCLYWLHFITRLCFQWELCFSKLDLFISITRRRGDSQQQGLAYPGVRLVEGLRLGLTQPPPASGKDLRCLPPSQPQQHPSLPAP